MVDEPTAWKSLLLAWMGGWTTLHDLPGLPDEVQANNLMVLDLTARGKRKPKSWALRFTGFEDPLELVAFDGQALMSHIKAHEEDLSWMLDSSKVSSDLLALAFWTELDLVVAQGV